MRESALMLHAVKKWNGEGEGEHFFLNRALNQTYFECKNLKITSTYLALRSPSVVSFLTSTTIPPSDSIRGVTSARQDEWTTLDVRRNKGHVHIHTHVYEIRIHNIYKRRGGK